MLTQAPKGTRDVLPSDSYRWQYLEQKMREAAATAGYREIRTPVFEHTELFLRSVGDTTDIVQKEMYTFRDKGDRSITLKPEGTAGAVRAFVEHGLFNEPLPAKMYYLAAPIFRYENPQSGRLREHHQFGMECFGAKEASADAELILVAYSLLHSLGLNNLTVNINSIGCPKCRPVYQRRLKEYLGERIGEMCATCRERFDRNPLRVLDCKEKHCQELVKDAPCVLDTLCDECREHFEQLKHYLNVSGIDYDVDPHIVRGLDYYTKTVFELITHTPDGNLTVCGGGRYDGLVEQLGGPAQPGVGFGMGLERVLMLLDAEKVEIPQPERCKLFVACQSAYHDKAFDLVLEARALNIAAEMDHCGRSLKAQFKYAGKLGANYVATIGETEAQSGSIRLKNMITGLEVSLNMDDVCEVVMYKRV